MARDTRTGAVLEGTILPCLTVNGYKAQKQVPVGLKPNGRRHNLDVLATAPDGDEILVSLKWQQTGGTAEEKIPFEVIKLIYTIEQSNGRYDRAYLVLGGDGWSLEDFYLSGSLQTYIPKASLVNIVTLEQFMTFANGYRPTLFLQEVRKRGGLEAAKHFLSTEEKAQTGLYKLADCGKLNISMECLVVRYYTLFTEHEVNVARTRLFEAATARPELYPDITAICGS